VGLRNVIELLNGSCNANTRHTNDSRQCPVLRFKSITIHTALFGTRSRAYCKTLTKI